MLEILRSGFHSHDAATSAMISISLMLLGGFLLTRLTKKLKMPNVTAYIAAGILLGPYCLDFIPVNIISGMGFLADIALAFVAFGTGQFISIESLKKNGPKVVVITLIQSAVSSVCVFLVMNRILNLSLELSMILASLAPAVSPTSTIMVIRQTNSKGDFVETLLEVLAFGNIVSLLTYSIATSAATAIIYQEGFNLQRIISPIVLNLIVFIIGGLFGVFMYLFFSQKHSTDNRLIVAIAFLFSFCGICSTMNISPLLGCMSMGIVFANLMNDDTIFKQLNYFNPPILLLFLVRSGLNFNLSALFNNDETTGSVSALLIAATYFCIRAIFLYLGSFLGCVAAKKPSKTRNYLGLTMYPQLSVAVGLAALGARTLGGDAGSLLQTSIIASSILFEFIAPICTKLALHLSGAYSDKLEDLEEVEVLDENGKPKNAAELLIERIQKIQEELPAHTVDEDEAAFTQAAEEEYNNLAKQTRFRNGPFRRL